jgi:hypothetical protein
MDTGWTQDGCGALDGAARDARGTAGNGPLHSVFPLSLLALTSPGRLAARITRLSRGVRGGRTAQWPAPTPHDRTGKWEAADALSPTRLPRATPASRSRVGAVMIVAEKG